MYRTQPMYMLRKCTTGDLNTHPKNMFMGFYFQVLFIFVSFLVLQKEILRYRWQREPYGTSLPCVPIFYKISIIYIIQANLKTSFQINTHLDSTWSYHLMPICLVHSFSYFMNSKGQILQIVPQNLIQKHTCYRVAENEQRNANDKRGVNENI